jgi:IclR family transcriptional regulator, acetate operon repressor
VSDARASLVGAADHVLTLLEILRRDGDFTITAAAREMGVAPSTVHRLAQTLVYRGFAVRRPDRTYHPGPALPARQGARHWSDDVRYWQPSLARAAQLTNETVHLIALEGESAVFLDSVVSSHALTVGSRVGARLPAERNSGGKVLLATRPDSDVRALYASRADVDVDALLGQLATVRREGFAVTVAESERGITAMAVPARRPDGGALAVAVSGPSVRFGRRQALAVLPRLRQLLAGEDGPSGPPVPSRGTR